MSRQDTRYPEFPELTTEMRDSLEKHEHTPLKDLGTGFLISVGPEPEKRVVCWRYIGVGSRGPSFIAAYSPWRNEGESMEDSMLQYWRTPYEQAHPIAEFCRTLHALTQ